MKKLKNYHPLIYFLLFLILGLALFVRVYRVGQVLGFYYDQGRDALVIWDLWHKGKLFLIGPTTGIAGIFRGPFYYYLIAPFYLLGGGNPVWPAVFLALTSVLAIIILYYLGFKVQDRMTGLLAAVIASFSFYIIMASRWLSNPTPMLLLSLLLVWMMLLVTKGKKWAWPLIALIAGLSLFHFGSAGEVFYFPAIFLFAIWQIRRKNLPDKKFLLLSVIALLFTAFPLVVFDIRHAGLIRNSLEKFLIKDESFKVSLWQVVGTRLNFYYDVFTNKIFHWRRAREVFILGVIGFSFIAFLPKLLKRDGIKILLLLFLSPLLGLLFFQGNFGNIYGYYLTGYYLIFILLFAVVLGQLWKLGPGKIFIIFFLYVFLSTNFEVVRYKISDGLDGPQTVAFGNEKQALDWIYTDVGSRKFNVDVYVPPVIPYSYDYLFKWYGSKYGYQPMEEQVSLLYTLYEVDPPHPERLEAWLERQKGIGVVEEEARFGGITVQRRKRIETQN